MDQPKYKTGRVNREDMLTLDEIQQLQEDWQKVHRFSYYEDHGGMLVVKTRVTPRNRPCRLKELL